MLLLNRSEPLQIIFFQEILHKNSQTIHLYSFSLYICIQNILILDLATLMKIEDKFHRQIATRKNLCKFVSLCY